MSRTDISALERTAHETRQWLDDLADRTVFEFLEDHVDPGEMEHVRAQLPGEIEALFPSGAPA